MKNPLLTTVFLLAALFCFAQSGSITITSVHQRTDGSGYVDVYFNLSGPASAYNIAMQDSFDGGSTYTPIPPAFLSGDISGISPGSNKHIVWDGLGSFPNTFSTQARLELTATELTCGNIFTDPRDGQTYNTVQIGSLEELLSKIAHGGFPAIAVEDSLEGRLTDLDSNNILDRQYYVFYVFDRVEFMNHDLREAVKRKLRDISRKIQARMIRDRESDLNGQTAFGLRYLETGSITYRNIGPIGDNLIGLAVSFTLLESLSLKFNPEDWDENPEN